jgi:hypothetical protein
MRMKSTCSCAFSVAMGKTLKGLVIIALGMLAFTALAVEPPTHAEFRKVQKSLSIMDMEIKDSQDRKLGKVRDLALDLENGRIVEVLVSSGGFLGFGQKTIAVPPGAFVFDPIGGVLRFYGDKEKLKAAPDFAMSKWAEQCQSDRVADVYRYYGQEPYFAADGQNSKSGNTATEPLGYIQPSTKLLRLPIKNLQDKSFGSVNTFIFDLPNGKVLHVVALAPGALRTKSVIPARALRFNAAHDALYLDVSTEAFKNEPRFRWTYDRFRADARNNGDFEQETYSNAKVAANDGVNTRQNVQGGTANTYTPLAQGGNFADANITSNIYAAMRSDASLSQNAQNVEVGTLNGQVTLRGNVNTEEGKHIIGRIAARAGPSENVSNLLEVRPLPAADKQAN